MKLIMLGCGHGSAINCYNSCFLLKYNTGFLLVDSGGGNQILKQLKNKNIDISKINNIFISHAHMDHILGVLWIIRKLCPKYYNNQINSKINIYGNDDVIEKLKKLLIILLPKDFHYLIDKKIILNIVYNNSSINIENSLITFIDLCSFKIKQYGFVLKENKNKFSFIGDEPFNKKITTYIENSDYLFADAYMCGREADYKNPIKNHHHSTVRYTSSIAKKLNIKNLIISHTIDTNLNTRKKDFINDSKQYYNGNVYVPDDLEEVDLW